MVQSRQRTTRLSTLFISINLTGSTQLQSTVRSNRHLLHNIKEIRLMSTKIHRSINQNSNFRKDKRRMIVWGALTVVTLPSLLRYPSSQIRHGRAMLWRSRRFLKATPKLSNTRLSTKNKILQSVQIWNCRRTVLMNSLGSLIQRRQRLAQQLAFH